MTPPADLREIALLLRLRGLRVAAAERECSVRALAVADAEAALARRDARIAHWAAERQALAQYLVGAGAHDLPRFVQSTVARRAYLNEQHERETDERGDDVRALLDARQRLAAARARRAREQAREDETRKMLRRAATNAVVRRDERDAADAPMPAARTTP